MRIRVLVSIDPSFEHLTMSPPGTPGLVDVVLKVEPPEYRGVLDLEALCLELHRDLGFRVPRFKRFTHDDLEFLAIERFDRVDEISLPMESMHSVIAMADHDFRETQDFMLEDFPKLLKALRGVMNLASDTAEDLYRRFILALFTGNGDLHLENLSWIGGFNQCRLSPIYDPAPMRAWPKHDVLTAIPFDPSPYRNHMEFFIHFGEMLGLKKSAIREHLVFLQNGVKDYGEQVMAMERVPYAQKIRLSEIHADQLTLASKALHL